MKTRMVIIIVTVATIVGLTLGFVCGSVWQRNGLSALGPPEDSYKDPFSAESAIHLRIPESGKLEWNMRTTSISNVAVRMRCFSRRYGCPRPVVHVEPTTPFQSLWSVMNMLREEGAFVITIAWGADGETTYMDIPDHVCAPSHGPDMGIIASRGNYFVRDTGNAVDLVAARRLLSDLNSSNGHLDIIYDWRSMNVAQLIELMTIAKQAGVSETTFSTIEVQYAAQPEPAG